MHSRRQVYEGDLVMGFIAFLLNVRGVRVASCAQAGMALVKVQTGPAARPPPAAHLHLSVLPPVHAGAVQHV